MQTRVRKSCTLYYSATITNRVWRERKLALLNPATTKRTLRVAEALQFEGKRCFVISPGILPRTGGGKYFKPVLERLGCVPVVTLAQLASKFVGYMLTPFTAIGAARRISRKRRIENVIQYCYFPDAVVFSLWCKLAYGSRVVLDLEDICKPRMQDWRADSETKPFLQLWGWCLMKLSVFAANRVIIPSQKFADFVPEHKIILLPGCQQVSPIKIEARKDDKINVLMSGGITYENGMGILVDALRLVDKPGTNFRLWICGGGKVDWLAEQVGQLTNVEVKVYGFLDNAAFSAMYRQVDVCLALQNPNGRHARFKSPSKGFEAICSGKALIVSDIGDFGRLPDSVCFHLRPYAAEKLADILASLKQNEVSTMGKNAFEYAKAHYDIPVVRRYLAERLGEDVR